MNAPGSKNPSWLPPRVLLNSEYFESCIHFSCFSCELVNNNTSTMSCDTKLRGNTTRKRTFLGNVWTKKRRSDNEAASSFTPDSQQTDNDIEQGEEIESNIVSTPVPRPLVLRQNYTICTRLWLIKVQIDKQMMIIQSQKVKTVKWW